MKPGQIIDVSNSSIIKLIFTEMEDFNEYENEFKVTTELEVYSIHIAGFIESWNGIRKAMYQYTRCNTYQEVFTADSISRINNSKTFKELLNSITKSECKLQ